MKIDLVKVKFNATGSYKYKPFRYCCNKLEQNEGIIFTNEDLLRREYMDKDGLLIPQICTSHTEFVTSYEDEWEQTENYPIQFCPHCGKEIEINVMDEIDCSKEYNKLVQLRAELFNKYSKTDSKKEAKELSQKFTDLNNRINNFYVLEEYREDDYV